MILNAEHGTVTGCIENGENPIIENTDDYVRVPIVILQEMVLDYPERNDYTRHLISMEEFGKTLNGLRNTWERKELTIQHPPSGVVTEVEQVHGHVENVRIEEKRMRGDAVIYKDSATAELVTRLENGERIDVSAGYWCSLEPANGTLNGSGYDAVQRGIVGNHVAVILNGRGRCSFEHGCGLRANGDTITHDHRSSHHDLSTNGVVTNPYKGEHSARINDPERYNEIRRKNGEFGEGIDVLYGIRDNTSEVQSIRFDSDRFTVHEAKQWLRDHDMNYIQFEEAITGDKVTDEQTQEGHAEEQAPTTNELDEMRAKYEATINELNEKLTEKDKALNALVEAKHKELDEQILKLNEDVGPLLKNMTVCDKETLLNALGTAGADEDEDRTPDTFTGNSEKKEEYSGIGVRVINEHGQEVWVDPREVM